MILKIKGSSIGGRKYQQCCNHGKHYILWNGYFVVMWRHLVETHGKKANFVAHMIASTTWCIHVFECHFSMNYTYKCRWWHTLCCSSSCLHQISKRHLSQSLTGLTYKKKSMKNDCKRERESNWFESKMNKNWIFLIELHTHCIATTNDQLAEKDTPNLMRKQLSENGFIIQQFWMKLGGIGQLYWWLFV